MRFLIRDSSSVHGSYSVVVELSGVPIWIRMRIAATYFLVRYGGTLGAMALAAYFLVGVMVFAIAFGLAGMAMVISGIDRPEWHLAGCLWLIPVFGVLGVVLGTWDDLCCACSIIGAGSDGECNGGCSMFAWSARARVVMLLCDAGYERYTMIDDRQYGRITATAWIGKFLDPNGFETPTFWRRWIAGREALEKVEGK